MKMWWVQVGDAAAELMGQREKEFYVSVFGDCCKVREIQLPESNGSGTMEGDE